MNKHIQQLIDYIKDDKISNEKIQIVTKHYIYNLSKDSKVKVDWSKGIVLFTLSHQVDKHYNIEFCPIITLKQKQVLRVLLNNRGECSA